MLTRYWSLALGVVYLLVGVIAFVPALYTAPPGNAPHITATAAYGYLLGIFPVNALHDVVHILVGLLGIAAFYRFAAARLYSRTLFIVFGLLTIMGFIPTLNTLFGLVPLFGADIPLHAATALASAYFGWIAAAPTGSGERPTSIAARRAG